MTMPSETMTEHLNLTSTRSLQLVASRRWGRRIAVVLLLLIALVGACLKYVPWQQSVSGSGEVIIFSPMERPQNIEAQIPGRIVAWNVKDGDNVRAGDTIAFLSDLESRFLDPEQPKHLLARKAALLQQRASAEARARELEEQIAFLKNSRNAAIPAAQERAKQARDRLRSAKQALAQARQLQRAAQEATVPVTIERTKQAEDQRDAAQEALTNAQQRLKVAQINYDRTQELYRKELKSRRDFELAEQDLVAARTGVTIAERQVAVATRTINVTNFDQTRADTELERARQEVQRAQAALDLALKDTTIGDLDQARVVNDTAATLNSIGASLNAANETIASITNSIISLDVDIKNLERRTAQQKVVAPRDGRIVNLMKVGAGATVKAGDVLAVLAPVTTDQHVQLMLSDNDAPLVSVERKVRLQFAGWPAIQFSGFPSAAIGTFGGVVRNIDPIDDGTSRYRVIIAPDWERIKAGKDQAWPPLPDADNPDRALTLRSGAQVIGWIMLDQVSLGYELWRQFNAFPPTVKREFMGEKSKKESKGEEKKSDEEKEKSGVKRRAK